VRAEYIVREDLGVAVLLHLETPGGVLVKAKLQLGIDVKEADEVFLDLPREKVRVFSRRGDLVL
jgi:hypothetical protein